MHKTQLFSALFTLLCFQLFSSHYGQTILLLEKKRWISVVTKRSKPYWLAVATCFQFLSFPSNSVMFICAPLNWGPSVLTNFQFFYAFSCIFWHGVKSFDPIMRLLISRREAQMTGKRLPLGVRSNPFNIGVGAGRPLAFTSVIIIIVIVITNITKCSNFPICFNQGWAVLISLLINIIAIDEKYKSCNLRRANCLTLKLAKAQHYQLYRPTQLFGFSITPTLK